MTEISTVVLLFAILFFCLLIEIPIAISIGITTLVGIGMNSLFTASQIPITLVSALDSFPLLCIPFFVLAGNIMAKGSMAKKLLDLAAVFFGRTKGSLGITATVASAFFAALSGSALATVTAIGGMTYQPMVEKGYRKSFAGILLASAGLLGPIIPPSISMIIYGIAANVSIADLFIAGVIPGIMMALAIIAVVLINMRIWGDEVTDNTTPKVDFRGKLFAIWDAKWAILMPVIILGGIYGGIVTPTEAAIIASAYALIVGVFIERDLKFQDFIDMLKATAITSGTIFIITGFATCFGYILNLYKIPTQLANFVVSITDNPILILLAINIFLLIVGCFMETSAAIIILSPILLPVAVQAGLTPLSFGIMMVVNLTIGGITPPVGMALFVAGQVCSLTIRELMQYLWQFLFALVAVLMIITYFPQLIEFLPALLAK